VERKARKMVSDCDCDLVAGFREWKKHNLVAFVVRELRGDLCWNGQRVVGS
jgi:hypothetical protein